MPNDPLYQPSVGFWSFIRMCIAAAYGATRDMFHADIQTVVVAITLLIVGYALFFLYRGRKEAANQAREDWLLTIAPLFLVGLVVFFFNLLRSPHLVYKDEHELARIALGRAAGVESQKNTQIANLQSQLDALASPSLHGGITAFIIGSDTSHVGSCVVTVLATISNTGAPSIATGFHLDLTLADGTAIATLPRLPPRKMATLYGGVGDKQSIVLYKEDYLVSKAIDQPIARGGAAPGFLMAEVEDCDKGRVDSAGTKVQLRFYDVNGKEYVAEQTTRGSKSMPFPY